MMPLSFLGLGRPVRIIGLAQCFNGGILFANETIYLKSVKKKLKWRISYLFKTLGSVEDITYLP